MAGVSGLINVRAQQRPEEPAFITGANGQALTWVALARCAARVRQLARQRRLPVRARIGLVVDDPLAFSAGYLAAGLTAVPIDPRLTSAEVAAAVARLRVDVLLTDHPGAGSGMPDVERWAARASGPMLVRAQPGVAWPSAGGVAAYHSDAFFAWTRARAPWIYAGCCVSVTAGVGVFLIQTLLLGQAPVAASGVFQPVVVAESVAIAWTFLALGVAWQRRRMPARRPVRAASDASFGVYLAHPLLLQGLLTLSGAAGLSASAGRAPGMLVTAVSIVIVVPLLYLTCTVLAGTARRTPVSLPLTGRTRRRTPQPEPAAPHESDGRPLPAAITVATTNGGTQCERQRQPA